MLTFLFPIWLWLLFPVLLWGLLATFRWKSLPRIRFKHAFVERFLISASIPYATTKRVVWQLMGVLLVFALAQPVWQGESLTQSVQTQQADGMILLETSVNMLLQEDNGLSRLQQAQQQLTALLQKRELARTGLTLFADEVYPVLSPTQDSTAVLNFLTPLQAALAGREDRALIEALQFSAWTLSQVNQTQNERSSWLLLVTDGAHAPSRGQLEPVLDWLTRHHIQLSVLMLGQAKSAKQAHSQGLLYTPRNMSLADKLKSQGIEVVLAEDQTAVNKLIEHLTRTSLATTQIAQTQTQRQQQALSNYLIGMMLVLWLGMWVFGSFRSKQK